MLAVDDDTTLLRLYELEMMGWDLPIEVVKGQNGLEALIKIDADKPNLLISDLSMPGMDYSRSANPTASRQIAKLYSLGWLSGPLRRKMLASESLRSQQRENQ